MTEGVRKVILEVGDADRHPPRGSTRGHDLHARGRSAQGAERTHHGGRGGAGDTGRRQCLCLSYKAARDDGEVNEGQQEAPDRDTLARRLQSDGQVVIRIEEFSGKRRERPALSFTLGNRLDGKDIDFITLELATLLQAASPLERALDAHASTGRAAGDEGVAGGDPPADPPGLLLSQAMGNQEGVFDRFYLNMVRAGEATGNLDLALERLADFKSKSRELRETLISSLIYPTILLVLALAAVAVMLTFVVPRFAELFDDAGRELPLLTQMVVGMGNAVENWWWAGLLVIAGLFWWLRSRWLDPLGREQIDTRLLRLPLIGGLIGKTEAARFTRTLGTLLKNGVNLLTAMGIAKEIVSNRVIAKGLDRVAVRVRQGEGLSRPLEEAKAFPELTTQLLKVGDETGRLEQMLEQLADIYEREVRTTLQRLLTLAEPVIILTIAGMITVIILSIVMAVIETNNLAF